jgi:hypothetical protein
VAERGHQPFGLPILNINYLQRMGTMEEQLEIAKLQAELTRMEQLAYTYHCELEVALDALKQIKEGRTTAREMIGTATWALNTLEDIKIAAADS